MASATAAKKKLVVCGGNGFLGTQPSTSFLVLSSKSIMDNIHKFTANIVFQEVGYAKQQHTEDGA